MNLATALPDVAVEEPAAIAAALNWVGMDGIAVPLQLSEHDGGQGTCARVALQVDLPAPQVRGIHMSRLYRLLDAYGSRWLTPAGIGDLLATLVHSHADCAASAARARWRFDWLRRAPALVTPGLSGWRRYPVEVAAEWRDGAARLSLQVEVAYSSTCPCSAALARQLLAEAFLDAHAVDGQVAVAEAADWLRRHGTHATPHSQRSLAQVVVALDPASTRLGLPALVERIERSLATPVQAAVRRADEQAFARLNGANPMYVEDAARRLQHDLAADHPRLHVQVRHLESLHPHDALASAGAGHDLASSGWPA